MSLRKQLEEGLLGLVKPSSAVMNLKGFLNEQT